VPQLREALDNIYPLGKNSSGRGALKYALIPWRQRDGAEDKNLLLSTPDGVMSVKWHIGEH
jgi:hypothetical protein